MVLVFTRSIAFERHLKRVVKADFTVFSDLEMPAEVESGSTVLVHVTDFNDPELSGFLRQHAASLSIAVAADAPNAVDMVNLAADGAHGYCNSFMTGDNYAQLLRLLAEGGSWFPPSLLTEVFSLAKPRLAVSDAEEPDWDLLTSREREVAALVAEGKSNKDIADSCHISERTVKAHLSSIFSKLQIENRKALIVAFNRATHTF